MKTITITEEQYDILAKLGVIDGNVEVYNPHQELINKYDTGDYICINLDQIDNTWGIGTVDWRLATESYKLIHKEHKEILDAWLEDNDVEIEVALSMTCEWGKEADFVGNYDEARFYRLAQPKSVIWTPEYGNKVFYINYREDVDTTIYKPNDAMCKDLYNTHNIYQTKEQAEQAKTHLDKTRKLIAMVLWIQGELGGDYSIQHDYLDANKSKLEYKPIKPSYFYTHLITMKVTTVEQICELLNSGRETL